MAKKITLGTNLVYDPIVEQCVYGEITKEGRQFVIDVPEMDYNGTLDGVTVLGPVVPDGELFAPGLYTVNVKGGTLAPYMAYVRHEEYGDGSKGSVFDVIRLNGTGAVSVHAYSDFQVCVVRRLPKGQQTLIRGEHDEG